MFIASGLPYAPHMYEIVSDLVPAGNDPVKLCALDSSRVLLVVSPSSAVLPVGAFYTVNGTGNSAPRFAVENFSTFRLNWYIDFNLVQGEVYATGWGLGVSFVVTEVRIDMSRIEEIANATRKPETLRSKIQRYFRPERWVGSGQQTSGKG